MAQQKQPKQRPVRISDKLLVWCDRRRSCSCCSRWLCSCCAGWQVASSIEELSPLLVGSCSRFRVDALPQPQPALLPASAAAAAAAAATATAGQPSAAAGAPDAAAAAGPTATAQQPPGDSSAAAANTTAPRPGVAKPLPVSAVPAAPKTLMVFDGCPLPLGCTVLLWGAPAAELTKLKRIVRFGVLAAYHLALENTFLSEELTLATAALATPGAAWGCCVSCSNLVVGCAGQVQGLVWFAAASSQQPALACSVMLLPN